MRRVREGKWKRVEARRRGEDVLLKVWGEGEKGIEEKGEKGDIWGGMSMGKGERRGKGGGENRGKERDKRNLGE